VPVLGVVGDAEGEEELGARGLGASAEARVDEDRLGPPVDGQIPPIHLAVERRAAGVEELEEEMPADETTEKAREAWKGIVG
jgi:hypothetical protein